MITAEGIYLDNRYFEKVGMDTDRVMVAGMENEPEFRRSVLDHEPSMDTEKMEMEIVQVAWNLVSEHSEIGAFVLECTQLPPYAKAIQEAVNLPIFDIIRLTNMVYSSVVRKDFTGIM